jgi:predicted aspartyl protease
MMNNVWGGCYHCYLVDAGAAVLVVPPSAASALNLELQTVTAGVVAAAGGGDAVAGYYQLLCNINIVTVLCNDSS